MTKLVRLRPVRLWLSPLLVAAVLMLVSPVWPQADGGTMATGAPSGNEEVRDTEWPTYGGDLRARRYSPLDQIDRSNVGRLEIAWRWRANNFGPWPEIRSSTTPLMVGGVLYTTAGATRSVVAIDAATGETLWMYRLYEGERGSQAPRPNSGRGVSYWSDGNDDEHIFLVTPGFHLVAIAAASGVPVDEFGEEGVVDLMIGTRGGVPPIGTIGSSSPPLVVGDLVIVGPAMRLGMRPPALSNTKGDVRAFDARTGELRWVFHTIPEAGEYGYETWLDDSIETAGNVAVWAPMSADVENGLLYLPVEAATNDYYGGHRPGDNLSSSSLVCLDVATGKRVWHYQLIHHDIWDYDPPTAPILVDLPADGRRGTRQRQLVAQLMKQGWAYVFDRLTGEPVWPIEQRSVPTSDVPGEHTAPMQPFVSRPPPFERQGFAESDLIDFTPELRAAALEVAARYRLDPLFTPPSLADAADGTRGTLSLPGALGGANWEAGAVDPDTGYLYVGSSTSPSVLSLTTDPENSEHRYVAEGGGGAPRVLGWPLVRPPWGRITAIDLKTGDLMWQQPNGWAPAALEARAAQAGFELGRTGKPTRAGVLATKTSLFAGEGWGGAPIFRAHDKQTGEVLAEINLPASQMGLPMTYRLDGCQFVVMSVGGGDHPAEIVALALPESPGAPI